MTKLGSVIGHRIDYNGGSERPAAHTESKLTQVPPPLPGRIAACYSQNYEKRAQIRRQLSNGEKKNTARKS